MDWIACLPVSRAVEAEIVTGADLACSSDLDWVWPGVDTGEGWEGADGG